MPETSSPPRSSTEDDLRRSVALLNAVTRVQSYFIVGADTTKLFDQLLTDLLQLTASEYGFIGEILHTDDGAPYLKTHAITNIAWNDETRDFYADNAPKGLEFFNLESLFGAVISTQNVVIANDPEHDPRKAGLPVGHPPLNAFLGLPVFSGGEMVGMMGIANRESGYGQALADWLTPLLNTYGNIIQAHRSDRRREDVEAELRARDQHTRSMMETVLDGIVTIDSSGIVQTFNPAAERIFGYTADDVIGQNVKMLMPPKHKNRHDDYLARHLETGEARIIGIGRQTEGMRKDGTVFPIDLAVSPMTVRGQNLFTGVIRDVTERQRMAQMQSEFISTVSHELRTPLTSIMGSLGLIRSGIAGELPTKVQSMLEIAFSNSQRLVTLINDILDIEKLATGKMQFDMRPTDMADLAREAIAANAAYAEQHDVTFRLVAADADAVVRGDKDRLMQVFANLLSNAAKFSPSGGVVDLTVQVQDDTILVTVADKGEGIPDAARKHLFQRFAQGDSSTTRHKGGTGLGLAITKNILERHLGRIDYDSTLGKGSTFYFEIPRFDRHEDTEPAHEDIAALPSVLVVEDDQDIATILVKLLRSDGYRVDVAFSAAEAKRKLASGKFDALTLDLVLPDEDGISLFREIRLANETRNLPIVVVSAIAERGSKELAGDAVGIIDWIDKPIDTSRMLNAVQTAVRGHAGPRRILHVEDDEGVLAVVAELLRDEAEVVAVPTLKKARSALRETDFNAIILDLTLPDGAGEELMTESVNKDGNPIPVIVFSARELDGDAAETINAVLMKSRTTNDTLLRTIRKVLNGTKRR